MFKSSPERVGRQEVKAIFVPSGDHATLWLAWPKAEKSNVSRTGSLPSAFMT